jgi:hypothetical protein
MKKCILRHSGMGEELKGVIKDGKAYCINLKGEAELPFEYWVFHDCDHGLVEIKIGTKWGFAYIGTGEIVILPQWDWVGPFYGEYAHVANRYRGGQHSKTGEHGYINKHGECVVPLEYTGCNNGSITQRKDEEEKNFFIVKKGNLYGIVNEKNEVVIPFKYREIKYDYSSENLICKKGQRYGVLSLDNTVIVPFEYTIYKSNSSPVEHWFGVRYKGAELSLKPESYLLLKIFGISATDEHFTDKDYTYYQDRWVSFYDENFNEIHSVSSSNLTNL